MSGIEKKGFEIGVKGSFKDDGLEDKLDRIGDSLEGLFDKLQKSPEAMEEFIKSSKKASNEVESSSKKIESSMKKTSEGIKKTNEQLSNFTRNLKIPKTDIDLNINFKTNKNGISTVTDELATTFVKTIEAKVKNVILDTDKAFKRNASTYGQMSKEKGVLPVLSNTDSQQLEKKLSVLEGLTFKDKGKSKVKTAIEQEEILRKLLLSSPVNRAITGKNIDSSLSPNERIKLLTGDISREKFTDYKKSTVYGTNNQNNGLANYILQVNNAIRAEQALLEVHKTLLEEYEKAKLEMPEFDISDEALTESSEKLIAHIEKVKSNTLDRRLASIKKLENTEVDTRKIKNYNYSSIGGESLFAAIEEIRNEDIETAVLEELQEKKSIGKRGKNSEKKSSKLDEIKKLSKEELTSKLDELLNSIRNTSSDDKKLLQYFSEQYYEYLGRYLSIIKSENEKIKQINENLPPAEKLLEIKPDKKYTSGEKEIMDKISSSKVRSNGKSNIKSNLERRKRLVYEDSEKDAETERKQQFAEEAQNIYKEFGIEKKTQQKAVLSYFLASGGQTGSFSGQIERLKKGAEFVSKLLNATSEQDFGNIKLGKNNPELAALTQLTNHGNDSYKITTKDELRSAIQEQLEYNKSIQETKKVIEELESEETALITKTKEIERTEEEVVAAAKRRQALLDRGDKFGAYRIKSTIDGNLYGLGEGYSSRTTLNQLKNAHEAYDISLKDNWDWEKQYQWAVSFVKLFEQYKSYPNATEKSLSKHTELYEELLPYVKAYEKELQRILDFDVKLIDVNSSTAPTTLPQPSNERPNAVEKKKIVQSPENNPELIEPPVIKTQPEIITSTNESMQQEIETGEKLIETLHEVETAQEELSETQISSPTIETKNDNVEVSESIEIPSVEITPKNVTINPQEISEPITVATPIVEIQPENIQISPVEIPSVEVHPENVDVVPQKTESNQQVIPELETQLELEKKINTFRKKQYSLTSKNKIPKLQTEPFMSMEDIPDFTGDVLEDFNKIITSNESRTSKLDELFESSKWSKEDNYQELANAISDYIGKYNKYGNRDNFYINRLKKAIGIALSQDSIEPIITALSSDYSDVTGKYMSNPNFNFDIKRIKESKNKIKMINENRKNTVYPDVTNFLGNDRFSPKAKDQFNYDFVSTLISSGIIPDNGQLHDEDSIYRTLMEYLRKGLEQKRLDLKLALEQDLISLISGLEITDNSTSEETNTKSIESVISSAKKLYFNALKDKSDENLNALYSILDELFLLDEDNYDSNYKDIVEAANLILEQDKKYDESIIKLPSFDIELNNENSNVEEKFESEKNILSNLLSYVELYNYTEKQMSEMSKFSVSEKTLNLQDSLDEYNSYFNELGIINPSNLIKNITNIQSIRDLMNEFISLKNDLISGNNDISAKQLYTNENKYDDLIDYFSNVLGVDINSFISKYDSIENAIDALINIKNNLLTTLQNLYSDSEGQLYFTGIERINDVSKEWIESIEELTTGVKSSYDKITSIDNVTGQISLFDLGLGDSNAEAQIDNLKILSEQLVLAANDYANAIKELGDVNSTAVNYANASDNFYNFLGNISGSDIFIDNLLESASKTEKQVNEIFDSLNNTVNESVDIKPIEIPEQKIDIPITVNPVITENQPNLDLSSFDLSISSQEINVPIDVIPYVNLENSFAKDISYYFDKPLDLKITATDDGSLERMGEILRLFLDDINLINTETINTNWSDSLTNEFVNSIDSAQDFLKTIRNIITEFDNLGNSATSSIPLLEEESQAFTNIGETSEKASSGKRKVRTENEDLAESAEKTIIDVDEEGNVLGGSFVDSANNAAESKEVVTKKNKELAESADDTVEFVSDEERAFNDLKSNAEDLSSTLDKKIKQSLANNTKDVTWKNVFSGAKTYLNELSDFTGLNGTEITDRMQKMQDLYDSLEKNFWSKQSNYTKKRGSEYVNLEPLGIDTNDINSVKQYLTDLGTMKFGNPLGEWIQNGQTLTRVFEDGANGAKRLTVEVGKMGQISYKTDNALTPKTLLKGGLAELGSGFEQYLSRSLSFYAVFGKISQEFSQGINTLTEYNDALTKISYTMDLTKSQLDTLGQGAVSMAKDLGSPIKDAMEIYQIYANMNTTTKEIEKMAKPTLILSNLTGISAEQASTDIQAVVNQFDLAQDQFSHIADVYDYISKNVAIDYSAGIESIASGVQNVGNVAATAGLSFEQLSAIIAKVSEQTRQDGSQISNSLKTIFTRISKASSMSDEVDNETLSNASKSLNAIGIDVYEKTGEYRDFITIMTELSQKWDDLTDAQKSNISFQVAATRNTSTFQSIVKQFSSAMDLATEATNAYGNAAENQEKRMDSFSGKIQKLSTDWDAFMLNVLNSDMSKFVLDIADVFVKGLDGLGDIIGHKTVGIFTSVGALLGTSMLSGMLKTVITGKFAEDFGKNVLKLINFEEIKNQFLSGYNTYTEGGNVLYRGDIAGGIGNVIASMNPVTKGLLAIGATIGVITVAYDALTTSQKEATDKLNESSQNYEETKNEIQSVNDELTITNNKISELEAKKSLSFVEQSELENLKETNKQLEQRKDLLEEIKNAEQEQQVNAVDDAYTATYGSNSILGKYAYDISEDRISNAIAKTKTTSIADENNLNETIALYRVLKQSREAALESSDLKTYDSLDEKLSSQKLQITSAISQLQSWKDIYDDFGYDKLTDTQKQYYDSISSNLDFLWKEINPEKWKSMKFDELFNSDRISKYKNDIEKFGKSFGEIDVDTFKDKFSDVAYYIESQTDKTGLTLEEFVNEINSSFGLIDYEKVKEKLETSLIPNFDNAIPKDRPYFDSIEKWISGLSEEELDIVYKVNINPEIDTSSWNVNDWKNYIKENLPEELKPETAGDLIKDSSKTDPTNLTGWVDKYQSSISSLTSILSTLKTNGKLEPGQLTDLFQEFPELENYTNNIDELDKAISQLTFDNLTNAFDKIDEFSKENKIQDTTWLKNLKKDLIDLLDFSQLDNSEFNRNLMSSIDNISFSDYRNKITKLNDFSNLARQYGNSELGQAALNMLSMQIEADPSLARATYEELVAMIESNIIHCRIDFANSDIAKMDNIINQMDKRANVSETNRNLKNAKGETINESDYTEDIHTDMVTLHAAKTNLESAKNNLDDLRKDPKSSNEDILNAENEVLDRQNEVTEAQIKLENDKYDQSQLPLKNLQNQLDLEKQQQSFAEDRLNTLKEQNKEISKSDYKAVTDSLEKQKEIQEEITNFYKKEVNKYSNDKNSEKYIEALKNYNQSLLDSSSIDSTITSNQQTRISDLQSQLTSLDEALINLRSNGKLEGSDLINLKDTIPEVRQFGEEITESTLSGLKNSKLAEYSNEYFDSIKEIINDPVAYNNAENYFKDTLSNLIGQDVDFDLLKTNLRKEMQEALTLEGKDISSNEMWKYIEDSVNDRVNFIKEALNIDDIGEAFDKTSTQVDKYQSKMSALNQAQEEFSKTGKLSADTLKTLIENGYDAQKITKGMKDGFHDLSSSASEDFMEMARNVAEGLPKEEAELWIDYCKQIVEANKEAASSFELWQKAMSESQAGANYDTIQGQLANMKKLFDEGWTGNTQWQTFAQMINEYGVDSIEQFSADYKKASRYITEDTSGMVNALNDLQTKGLASQKEDGSWLIYAKTYQEAAEALETSATVAEEVIGKLKEQGLHIMIGGNEDEVELSRQQLEKDIATAEASKAYLDASGADQSLIDEQQARIDEYKTYLDSYPEVIAQTKEDAVEEMKTLQEAIAKTEKDGNKQATQLLKDRFDNVLANSDFDSMEEALDWELNIYPKIHIKEMNEELDEALQGESKEEIRGYVDELGQYTADELSQIDVKNGYYDKGFESAEMALDSLIAKLGLTKDEIIELLSYRGELEGTTDQREQEKPAIQDKSDGFLQSEYANAQNHLEEKNAPQPEPELTAEEQWNQSVTNMSTEADNVATHLTDLSSALTNASEFINATFKNPEKEFSGQDKSDGFLQSEYANAQNHLEEKRIGEIKESIQNELSNPENIAQLSQDYGINQNEEKDITASVVNVESPKIITGETLANQAHQTSQFNQNNAPTLKNTAVEFDTSSLDKTVSFKGIIEEVDDSELKQLEENPLQMQADVNVNPIENVTSGITNVVSSVSQTAEVDVSSEGQGSVESLKNSIDEVNDKTAKVVADTEGKPGVDSLVSSINNVHDKNAEITANTTGGDQIAELARQIDNLHDKDININIRTNRSGSSSGEGGTIGVNGSAHLQGSAHASGNWGTNKSEDALVGELGQELLVDPSSGTWQTIGDNGAEFRHIPKGSIIFNHKQTESLLNNGYVTSRGKALASGNVEGLKEGIAFLNGTSYLGGVTIGNKENPVSGSVDNGLSDATDSIKDAADSVKKDSKDTSKSVKDELSKGIQNLQTELGRLFDFVQIRLDYLERKASRFYTKYENFVKRGLLFGNNYTKASNNLEKSINTNKKAYTANEQGAERYAKQAKTTKNKFDKKLKGKDKNKFDEAVKIIQKGGIIDIREYSADVRAGIEAWQQWYDASEQCKQNMLDIESTLIDQYQAWYHLPLDYAAEQLERINLQMSEFNANNAYALAGAKNLTADQKAELYDQRMQLKVKTVEINQEVVDTLQKEMQEKFGVTTVEEAEVKLKNIKVTKDDQNVEYEKKQKSVESKATSIKKDTKLNANLSKENKERLKVNKTIQLTNKEKKKLTKEQQKEINQYNKLVKSMKEMAKNLSSTTEEATGLEAILKAILEALGLLFESQEDLAQQAIDDAKQRFEDKRKEFENEIDLRQQVYDLIRASGEYISSSAYDPLIKKRTKEVEALKKQLEAEANVIEKGSDAWYELQMQIVEVNTELEELLQAQREIRLDELFDRAAESCEKFIDKLSVIKNMIIDEMKFNPETGELTQFGAMSYTIDYKSFEEEKEALRLWSERRQDTLVEWQRRYGEKYGNVYLRGISEALDAEMDEADSKINSSYQNIQSTIMNMIGLIVSAYEKERDAIIKVLNERKKSLQIAKDEYDFDKKLKQENEDVLKLQKQISALRGQKDTEEGRAKLQKLEEQLKEAEEKRDETIQERMYNMQQQAFDDLNEDINDNYTDLINELKSTPQKISDGIELFLKKHGIDDDILTKELQSLFGVYVGDTITSNSGIIENKYGVGQVDTLNKNDYVPMYLENNSSPSYTPSEPILTEKQPESNNTQTQKEPESTTSTYSIRDNATHYLYSNGIKNDTGKDADKYSDDKKSTLSAGTQVSFSANALKPENIITVDGKQFAKAKILDSNGNKVDSGYVNLNGVQDDSTNKKLKYAKGAKYITKDQLAITQDGGQELVYRHSDGSMLTPLGKGDKVFTNAQTNALWELSKGIIPDGMYNTPNLVIPSSANSQDTNVTAGDFVFNISGVTDINAFINEIQHNQRFERTIQSITVDRLAGKSKLRKYTM